MSTISKFGYRLGVGATWEPVWPGAAPYPFPTVAAPIEVEAGGNAADTLAGTGARTVRVYGLDANFEYVQCDLVLNGVLASAPSAESFLRVYRARILTAGSSEVNAADVSIAQVGGSALVVIPADNCMSQQAIWTVPAGWKVKIQHGRVYAEGSKPVDWRLIVRTGIDGLEPVRRAPYTAFGVEFEDKPEVKFPTSFLGPCDIWIEARSQVAADVVGRFEGELSKA